jgi:hypothetical protein
MGGVFIMQRNEKGQFCKIELEWEVNENGCWVVTSHKQNTEGYPVLRRNGKPIKAHQYMYKKYNGDIPIKMVICHKCDNPQCCNPEHLFLGTQADNVRDMFFKERNRNGDVKGEKNGSSKLTEKEVIEIRNECKNMKHKDIAKKYGVARNTITYILNNKLWKHI